MIRRTLPTLAALALLLGASPALAQPSNPERNLYETAREMWERELTPNTRAELQPRWAEIEALKGRVATLEGSLAQNDPRRAALEALIAKQQAARTQGSGTLRGTHGGQPGTDGRSIGLRNFEKADALISKWASEGKPMTVERLQEINRVLGTGLQHNGRPPGTIRANAGENITAGGRFHYVPGRYVGEAMQQFTQWYEASKAAGMAPAELAGKAYMRLVSIHPFWDANGRSTRMLMDWVLRSHGLPSVALQDVMVAVFGQRPVSGVPAEKAVIEVTKALEKTLQDRLAVLEGNGQGFATRRSRGGPLQPSRIPAAEVEALFNTLKGAGAERLAERISAAEGAERVALALSKPRLERLSLEIVPTNDILAEQKGERVRISTGLLNEIHARGAGLPAALQGEARARVLGLILAHEIAHAGGIKAERAADAEALRVFERAKVAGPLLRADLRNALEVFSKPTGATHLDRLLGRLGELYRYGTPGGRLAALERAARGEADRLASYRRADGTLRWKALASDGLLREGGALAHFTLALFLKELAMVVRTGDRLRIEEFFDGVMTTDFFKHYGLFALGARGGELLYGRYLAQHLRQGFVSSLLKTHIVLMTGLALPQIVSGEFEGKTFMISVASLGL
ncbi:MAG TPA: hypothetical protein DEA08_38445, partial [Planctomycetes bacterium]|nr:hypothetical protein [Planctomycetota bacterium]